MNLVELLEKYKIVFSEVYRLVLLSITIPVLSAACEIFLSFNYKKINEESNVKLTCILLYSITLKLTGIG